MRALTVILVLLVPFVAGAQERKTATKPRPQEAKDASSFAVDSAAVIVSPSLGTGDPRKLLDSFRAPPKGEFESTADYNLRAPVAYGDRFFALNITCGAPLFLYDADKEKFKLTLFYKEAGFKVIEARCTSHKSGSYVGTNAFGVKKNITEIEGASVSISSDSLWISPRVLSDVEFAMPLAEAMATKPYLSALVVFSPVVFSPVKGLNGRVIVSTSEDHKPTIDSPYEKRIDHDVFWARNISLWVIDGRTGRVIASNRSARPMSADRSLAFPNGLSAILPARKDPTTRLLAAVHRQSRRRQIIPVPSVGRGGQR